MNQLQQALRALPGYLLMVFRALQGYVLMVLRALQGYVMMVLRALQGYLRMGPRALQGYLLMRALDHWLLTALLSLLKLNQRLGIRKISVFYQMHVELFSSPSEVVRMISPRRQKP